MRRLLFWALGMLFLAGCASPNPGPTPGAESAVAEQRVEGTATPPPSPTPSHVATQPLPPPTLTPVPTSTGTAIPTATATATATPTHTPTATPIGACAARIPADGLLALVTAKFGLSRDYAPAGLVNLNDYFDRDITLGYPTEVRQIVIAPLQDLIEAMQSAGLAPIIISGYRSYAAQAIAYEKWSNAYDYATNISAAPGHSEHQLGTTVDFGSPNLPDITGDPDLQFHTYFYMTPEGEWLVANAHRFGFTLSYPREAFDVTGFYYEPWHFRYVGVDLASELTTAGITFTEYILARDGEPCIP